MADEQDDVNRARRRLLKMMAYSAPIVMSTVVVKPAHAQLLSCGPNACRPGSTPCSPNGCSPIPCGPFQCKPRA